MIPVNTRQAEVGFYWVPVGTAGAYDGLGVDDVQLEIVPAATGYVASDFERLNFAEQLLLCQRHYQKTFNYAAAPASSTGTGGILGQQVVAGATSIVLPYNNLVPMRVGPSVATFNPNAAGIHMRNNSNSIDCTGTTVGVMTTQSGYVTALGAAGAAATNLVWVNATFDAGI